jgi:rod shape-determining protein MreC
MSLWEKRRNAVILAGLLAFHVLLISIQVPRGAEKSLFESSVFFLFSPVQRAVTGAIRGVGSLWTDYIDLRRVRGENQKLKKEVFFLNQERRFLEDRLAFFRAEAEVRASLADFRGAIITARVIGVDSGNPYQSIVIGKGSLDGVRKNMAVCDRNGNLVGRTIDPVSLKETMVQLITDKDSSVSVISAVNGLTGSVCGRSAGICELRYVLASITVGQEGEALLTTGYDKIYPAGLRVGRIRSLEKNESSPLFRRIAVEPYFQFNTIDAVAVLAKSPGGGG